jgi:hypothetical protein
MGINLIGDIMVLPVLETPTYDLVLPSTNKKIKFRPFLVKEHKILMTLSDAEDSEVIRVIKEIIDVCTFKKLNVDKLPNFDIEYIFLNLRSKSIGEKVDIIVNCPCGNKIEHSIDLNEVKVERKEQSNKIVLRDNLTIVMRYPTFEEVAGIISSQDTMQVFEMVSKCIDEIHTAEESFDRSLFTNEEASNFISQLTKDEFFKIEEFFVNMPKVVQEVKAKCNQCGRENEVKMEGLENFFV